MKLTDMKSERIDDHVRILVLIFSHLVERPIYNDLLYSYKNRTLIFIYYTDSHTLSYSNRLFRLIQKSNMSLVEFETFLIIMFNQYFNQSVYSIRSILE